MSDIVLVEGLNELNVAMTPLAPGLTKLFGVVTDAESGNAIIGVKVSIRDLFTYTDSLGYYLIAHIYEPLTPGSYTVTFEKLGYKTVVTSVVLVAGDNELNVEMMLVTGPITLTVLAPEDVAFKDYETYKLNDWYIMVGNDRWFVGQVGRYVRRGGGGARFQGVPIPRGKTIKTARLHFISASDNTKTVLRSRIRGVAADSTTPFSTMEDYNSKLANTTSAVVTWDNVPGVDYFVSLVSPEIKSIIQEIVNRPGWQYGNNLTLFWEDHEGRSDDARRVVYAYHPTYAPILYVEVV